MATDRIESVRDVSIVLFEGFDELDAIGPYEVWQNAAERVDLTVRLCTLAPVEAVRASHGLRVVPDGILEDTDPDLLVVPGGGWNDRAPRGVRAEVESGALPEVVAAHYESGGVVASVCTGGMVLEAAGVLDGRPAVTHRGAIDDLRERGVETVDARVVDGGDVVTAGGVTAGIDLALYLTDRIAGTGTADRIAREMEYDRTGDVYRSEAGTDGA